MKKIVIIDHEDSFTYNIVELIRQALDIQPTVINHQKLCVKDLKLFDYLILSPGPGLPDDFVKIKTILDVYKQQKPILGICLGHQAIATYFGGSLYNLKKVVHGQPHLITHLNNSSLFKNIPANFIAGLYHSWAVNPKALPAEIMITAMSSSGVVMALQHKFWPVYGIQFHPESYMTAYGLQLIKNFVNA